MTKFGFGPPVPGVSASDVAAFRAVVSDRVGQRVETVEHASYEALIEALAAGDVELAWLPPIAFVRARERGGVTLLVSAVRSAGASYRSALFVREDEPFRHAADLRGRACAWVSRSSASGYLFAQLALREVGGLRGSIFSQEVFLGSHLAVVEAVADGVVDAGATYVNMDHGGQILGSGWLDAERGPMRAILTSEEIPADTICAHDALSTELRKRWTRVLTELHVDEAGAAAIGGIFHAVRFEPTHSRRYDVVQRALASDRPGPPDTTQ